MLIHSTEESVLSNVVPGETEVVIEVEDLPAPGSKGFIVEGLISGDDGGPLAGVSVEAFDRDWRGSENLGLTRTDDQGRYRITYAANQFRRTEKKTADLIIRVLL